MSVLYMTDGQRDTLKAYLRFMINKQCASFGARIERNIGKISEEMNLVIEQHNKMIERVYLGFILSSSFKDVSVGFDYWGVSKEMKADIEKLEIVTWQSIVSASEKDEGENK